MTATPATVVTASEVRVASGEYVEIDEPAKVAFTWGWVGQAGPTTRVTIELSEDGQGTRLVLTHAGMTGEEDAANHAQGWDGCLVRLPSVVAEQRRYP